MTPETYRRQIWIMFGVLVLIVGFWVFTVPTEDFWSIPGIVGPLMVGGSILVMTFVAVICLSLLTYLPSYRWYLLVLSIMVVGLFIFIYAGSSRVEAIQTALMLLYLLMPFAVAAGAIYQIKVRRRLRWAAGALIVPLVWHMMQPAQSRGGMWHQAAWWPPLLAGDLVVIIWFYLAMREDVAA